MARTEKQLDPEKNGGLLIKRSRKINGKERGQLLTGDCWQDAAGVWYRGRDVYEQDALFVATYPDPEERRRRLEMERKIIKDCKMYLTFSRK